MEQLHSREVNENMRFRPHQESLAVLKDIREKLKGVQGHDPAIRGLAFFGSRVLGVEKEDSDVDIVVFYDSDIQKRTQTKVTTKNIERRLKVGKTLGTYPVGPMEYWGQKTSKRFFSLDIAPSSLDKKIQEFVALTDTLTNHFTQQIDIGKLNWRLGLRALEFASLFFLSIGDSVYQARKHMLDELEKLPNGDAYFATLMKLVSFLERGISSKRKLPVFSGYPQTIADARKYFILDDDPEYSDRLSSEVEEFCKSHRAGIALRGIKNALGKFIESHI